VGGVTAEHLLAHGKEVRALVRNREKASSWANKGVELVDGDWNDAAAVERALKGVDGAFVMLPAVWAPSPDYKEAKGRDCKLCRGAHQCSAAASGCAFVDGCEQDQRAWDDHGLVASGARAS
jgi:putative NADH-flavin reductase